MDRYDDKVSSLLVPDYILKDFDIYDVHQQVSCCVIEMYEKEDRIPVTLRDYSDVVLDGYCNPVEMLSHSFVLYICKISKSHKSKKSSSKKTTSSQTLAKSTMACGRN